MPARIETLLFCNNCKTDKNIREFSQTNIWKVKEERLCKSCIRLTKKERFLAVRRKLGNYYD